jgi:diacylglycerol kinase family enzyme|tara:strand:+ start:9093 stop:9956 length:864 start_codon:yes stop_codon:yes gene_type:complete
VTATASSAQPPHRAWLVINPSSHSFTDTLLSDIRNTADKKGLKICGESRFPKEELPDQRTLEAHSVDTVILFGGDGTIDAMACHVADWPGNLLLLPGGTMNMLPRRLHGDAGPCEIIRAACEAPAIRSLPFVQAGPHRSFVSILAGPAATFVHAREALRAGRLRRLWRALGFAWRISWSRRIHVSGLNGGFRLVMAEAGEQAEKGKLRVAGIRARHLGDLLTLVRSWWGSNWRDATTVAQLETIAAELRSTRPIHALFDGEERILESPVHLSAGLSKTQFYTSGTDQ